jgi:hypothetical protein
MGVAVEVGSKAAAKVRSKKEEGEGHLFSVTTKFA